MYRLLFVALIAFISISGCSKNKSRTLFYNGKVMTLDDDNPEINRFIVENGRILETDPDQVSTLAETCTDSVDLGGQVVLPGLTDSHLHLFSLGFSLMNLDVSGERSISSIQKKLLKFSIENRSQKWLKGRGWDQNLWMVKEFPSFSDLDRIVKDKPVVLTRIDGHAIWVNSITLERAGINKFTPDPPGGKILRDEKGNPTGVFIDKATDLITRHIPEPDELEMTQALKLAVKACNQVGLTSIHDAGTTLSEIKVLKENLNEPWFNLRVYSLVSTDSVTWGIYKKKGSEIGLGDDRLTIRGVKIYADGALGSRGAWLLEDYSDQPGNHGLPQINRKQLEKIVMEAVQCGMQPAIHAIGDAANQLSLDVFRKFSETTTIDHRFRIEHAQIVASKDLARFGAEKVIASMQPVHATSDMAWAVNRVGFERIRGGYAWRSILDDGGILSFGSDAPVESVNPFWGIYAAVNRQDHNGYPTGGWYPGEALSVKEALSAFTEGANFAGFNEKSLGKIKPGFHADFIAADQDLFEMSTSDLFKVKVLSVWFSGNKITFIE